jgi:hypothetical protein
VVAETVRVLLDVLTARGVEAAVDATEATMDRASERLTHLVQAQDHRRADESQHASISSLERQPMYGSWSGMRSNTLSSLRIIC